MQISSLQSSQSLTMYLRTCLRHVSHAEWHRHSVPTKKVRCILSQVANRCLSYLVRFAQVANNPGLPVSAGGTGASGTSRRIRVCNPTPHESFCRHGK